MEKRRRCSLTVAEALRTSVLSQRWQNMWHSIVCLDFNSSTVLPLESLDDLLFNDYSPKHKQDWYISWVNKVLEGSLASPGQDLKELKIHHLLNACHQHQIDKWIHFPMAKRIESLHFELRSYTGKFSYGVDQYQLCEEAWFNSPTGLSNIRCLKSLTLSCVKFTTQFMNFIFTNCSLLELLSIEYLGAQTGPEISVSSYPVHLKRLRICSTYDNMLLNLCAPNLTSFEYRGPRLSPDKVDVPKLVDLSVGLSRHILKHLKPFWSRLSQLESLELQPHWERTLKLNHIPKLYKLKRLTLHLGWDPSALCSEFIQFMKACPLLENFILKMVVNCSVPRLRTAAAGCPSKDEQGGQKQHLFQCLKTVEFVGICDEILDMMFPKCVISNAPHIEKIVLNTQRPSKYKSYRSSVPEVIETIARKIKSTEHKAKKLQKRLPVGTTVVIIR
uniref:At1g61320/AtMIF1 LRR domain-containing protein n=1 Tax=Kalanchoe fedtschenkoi TaxID=63787 RepID=A0A7N1A780_KALFE